MSRTGSEYVRMFSYASAADTSFVGTTDTRLMLATDNTHVDAVLVDTGTAPTYNLLNFNGAGNVYGTTSRGWFYAMDGVGQPKKIDYSQHSVNTNSNWGIVRPYGYTASNGITYMNSSTVQPPNELGIVGTGYTSAPTVTISGGGGSGATATCAVYAGGVYGVYVTNGGTGYTSTPTVTFSGGGGSGATATAILLPFTTIAGTATTTTSVGAIVLTGNIILNVGRTYGIAFQNSVTGHVSDYIYQQNPSTYPTFADGEYYPNQESNNENQGVNQIVVDISFITPDPQVDHVVLMATSDGGDVEHMYQVAIIPLSSFTVSSGTCSYRYYDSVPDTYNDVYTSGPTLLTQNLWVDVDSNGNTIGIFDNTQPLATLNKPIVHQGRVFATDGKALYFSKSIDEVTTSTGLITCKWEEAWPGSNELDIAYGAENITGLLSDGTYLYIGTTDNVYRLIGDSASNFSIPATIFRGVGVQSQDAWSVMYKDNIPSGYMWVTADNKIMFSDFNTYNEIGKPIYPLIQELEYDTPNPSISSIQSYSYGPYSFGIMSIPSGTGLQHLIFDTKNGGWYYWSRDLTRPTYAATPNPLFSFTHKTGVQTLYTIIYPFDVAGASYLAYYNPTDAEDDALDSANPVTPIDYFIETSWINLQDTASSVVLNEIETWSDDPYLYVQVYRALDSTDFENPILVRGGPAATSPFGAGLGALLVFIRIVYTWFKDFDNSQRFIYDMAQTHLPYVYSSLERIADKLDVALEDRPNINFTQKDAHIKSPRP
ncbi:unnamed protein product [Sphagnum jensenii]